MDLSKLHDDAFGEEEEDESLLERQIRKRTGHSRPSLRALNKTFVITVCLALLLYSGILISATSVIAYARGRSQRMYGTRWMWSPANDYIRYKPRSFDLDESQQPVEFFPAHPSAETEAAWADLFDKQNLALSPEIMQFLGRKDQGLLLPDGNYFGTFTVFHHLHCLMTLYQQLHPEYFKKYQNVTGKPKESQDWHNGHCFSMLKQAVMCQGDTTFLTMKWDPDRALPIGNMSSLHECVDWDRLTEWSNPRSFKPRAKGWLVHPKLGPTFDDNGDWANNFDPVLGLLPDDH